VGSSDVSGSVVGKTERGDFEGGVPGRTFSRGSDEGMAPLSHVSSTWHKVGVILDAKAVEGPWHSYTTLTGRSAAMPGASTMLQLWRYMAQWA